MFDTIYLFYLRIDRDKAQKEADVLRQQLAPHGPVRSLLAALNRSEGADEKRLLEDPVPILKAPGTCVVIDVVERAQIPATLRHKEIFEFILNPNAKFKAGDIVLGKHADHGEQLFSGMVQYFTQNKKCWMFASGC